MPVRLPPSLLRRLPRHLGAASLGCLFALAFLVQPYKVEGTSMRPLIEDQERVLINKFIYDFREVKPGDVIVFRAPAEPNKSFIKRVIAVPGDVVEGRGGRILVNGRPLAESYLRPDLRGAERFAPQEVQEGTFFVLGDHRLVSSDSRAWGPVPAANISGKAVLRYWPPGHFGLID